MIYKRPHSIELKTIDYEKHFGSLAAAKKSCFNIGAGDWSHNAWTNIDLPPQSEAYAKIQKPCIHHNLVKEKQLPIKPCTAELIYTSHVIEHIPSSNVFDLFLSAYNCLKPGGILRVTTGPDADEDYLALARSDKEWWYFYDPCDFSEELSKFGEMTSETMWLFHLATPRSYYSTTPCQTKYNHDDIKALIIENQSNPDKLRDFLTEGLEFNANSPGDHLSWWNFTKTKSYLRKAGFKSIHESAYGKSASVFMRDLNYFDTTYPHVSLYVEAQK